MRILFITATPFNVIGGSGTFVGIRTLMESLRARGAIVDVKVPTLRFPIYTAQRLLFNQSLRFFRPNQYDVIVGFDMDGCWLPPTPGQPHVASIKGVIADEMRFETAMTKATMGVQAACEKLHIQRADLVITTSAYAAKAIQNYYGIRQAPLVVPELIDLSAWREKSEAFFAIPDESKFVVLSVCRFYRRKRLNILVGAANRLRGRIPGLEIRIVGGGPERQRLQRICRERKLDQLVTWRIDIDQEELLKEYQRCNVFCLPSVQEGFGIVFLEAMASGKPIVAANAGAAPEVVQHGLLVEPDSEDALAQALEQLYADSKLRKTLGTAGQEFVKQFDAPIIAERFLNALGRAVATKASV
ncbi:MAG: glycosyltransferase family 4 protein [Candidatus Korobacteraceae bacterium]